MILTIMLYTVAVLAAYWRGKNVGYWQGFSGGVRYILNQRYHHGEQV